MKINLLSGIILVAIIFLATSCDLINDEGVGGSQSPIGEVGNTFSVSSIPGLSGVSVEVTALSGGKSTVTYTANISNQTYLNMIKSMESISVTGSTVQRESTYRITSEGMESVYPEGSLTLVKYNAKVGDIYTLKRGTITMEREVTAVSSDDDFFWGGMMIKTIDVKETGRNIPGLSYILFRFNHKFGLVNVIAYFEDGSHTGALIYSDSNN